MPTNEVSATPLRRWTRQSEGLLSREKQDGKQRYEAHGSVVDVFLVLRNVCRLLCTVCSVLCSRVRRSGVNAQWMDAGRWTLEDEARHDGRRKGLGRGRSTSTYVVSYRKVQGSDDSYLLCTDCSTLKWMFCIESRLTTIRDPTINMRRTDARTIRSHPVESAFLRSLHVTLRDSPAPRLCLLTENRTTQQKNEWTATSSPSSSEPLPSTFSYNSFSISNRDTDNLKCFESVFVTRTVLSPGLADPCPLP